MNVGQGYIHVCMQPWSPLPYFLVHLGCTTSWQYCISKCVRTYICLLYINKAHCQEITSACSLISTFSFRLAFFSRVIWGLTTSRSENVCPLKYSLPYTEENRIPANDQPTEDAWSNSGVTFSAIEGDKWDAFIFSFTCLSFFLSRWLRNLKSKNHPLDRYWHSHPRYQIYKTWSKTHYRTPLTTSSE